MPSYTENDLQNAISAVTGGQSVRKAAQLWGIPRATLHDRIQGAQTRLDAYERYQRLSRKDEESLVQWVLKQASLNVPISHQQLRSFVIHILAQGGDHKPLGKNWMKGFLQRHPEISTRKGKRMDSCRINGASADTIKGFFSQLQLPVVRAILPQNSYNMDESGIQEGQGSNGLVLGNSQIRIVIRKHPGSRSWTTIIECISADGRVISPLVIFKGECVQQQWFPDKFDKYRNWHFTASPNGWTTDKIGLHWLREVFIPETTPSKPSEPRLLILDGHGSHVADDFMLECFKNNIYLLFLPEHSSHVLQPLDVGVFSAVKASYRTSIMDLQLSSHSTPTNKIIFLEYYFKARAAGITKRNILAGWKATGIYPLNMSRPLLSKLLVSAKIPLQETPQIDTKQQEDLLKTPQRGSEIHQLFHDIIEPQQQDPTARQLFRKIRKGIDKKNMQLVKAEREIQQLKHQIEAYKPRKKQKVVHDPNKKFVNIKDVEKARQRLATHLARPPVASDAEFEALCHEWQLDS
ncbi:transposase [Pochonia chlamydosporia 170]|uniref:Transposase n=1 Tax=Pochonia chlamydosporia 170 TaxID=1380566 RepID=A0A179EZ58_METCM|nr:transposase [Pochonia chlamydosporia 170]OAQ58123.1 transposase [Pochonia chlamydosporia 170]